VKIDLETLLRVEQQLRAGEVPVDARKVLLELAANHAVLFGDDTGVRILELQHENCIRALGERMGSRLVRDQHLQVRNELDHGRAVTAPACSTLQNSAISPALTASND